MKIQLERKLESCPDKLLCAVCGQMFRVRQIRTLLYSDRGWLEGDLCSHCQKLDRKKFKQKLYQRAKFFWKNSHTANQVKNKQLNNETKDPSFERALEILVLAQEKIKFPNFIERCFRKMVILAEESSELEQARLGLSKCYCEQRKKLEELFKEKET